MSSVYRLLEGLEFLWHRFSGVIPSQIIRKLMFRLAGGVSGPKTVFYGGTEIRCARKIEIGGHTSIGHQCILDGRGGLRIGNSVNISSGAWIWTAEHAVHSSSFEATVASVVIEDYAWISGRVVILPGITIGKGAVVATGAVVTKSVDPFVIVGGIPAKPIGQREQNLDYKLGSCMPFA